MKTAISAILSLLLLVVIVMLPLILGMAIYRIYRYIKPLEEVQVNHITEIDKVGDRFFLKSLVIGWLVCGPAYYWMYQSGIFF